MDRLLQGAWRAVGVSVGADGGLVFLGEEEHGAVATGVLRPAGFWGGLSNTVWGWGLPAHVALRGNGMGPRCHQLLVVLMPSVTS